MHLSRWRASCRAFQRASAAREPRRGGPCKSVGNQNYEEWMDRTDDGLVVRRVLGPGVLAEVRDHLLRRGVKIGHLPKLVFSR